MLIPIDRPLIDARNIREAATQTVAGDDVADPALIHNNRATLRVTLTGAGLQHVQGTAVQAIQSGNRVGQRLRIIVVDDGASNVLQIVDNAATAKTDLRGNWMSGGGESATTYNSYLDIEWDGTLWKEVERYDGVGWTALGIAAHGEGKDNVASGRASHAEGEENEATAWGAHAEGRYCDADGSYSHAEGYVTQANSQGSHAEGASCQANADYAHAMGSSSNATLHAGFAQAGGKFNVVGDAQFIRVVGRKLITMSDDWQTILFLDGDDDLLTIPANTLFNFEALVSGCESSLAAKKSAYKIIDGAIWRDNANNLVLLNQTVNIVHEDDASYTCECMPGFSGNLQIIVKDMDNDGVSVRWVAAVWGVMLSFP
ncbi:MAG: hypothetical protein KAT11_05015 [Phycisphaerae bacterium]|nr:hypothetical protein [Phycisphaerae bacterium]